MDVAMAQVWPRAASSEGEEHGPGHKSTGQGRHLCARRKNVNGQDGEEMGVTTGHPQRPLVSLVLFAVYLRKSTRTSRTKCRVAEAFLCRRRGDLVHGPGQCATGGLLCAEGSVVCFEMTRRKRPSSLGPEKLEGEGRESHRRRQPGALLRQGIFRWLEVCWTRFSPSSSTGDGALTGPARQRLGSGG